MGFLQVFIGEKLHIGEENNIFPRRSRKPTVRAARHAQSTHCFNPPFSSPEANCNHVFHFFYCDL